jgi:hypothetical protein
LTLENKMEIEVKVKLDTEKQRDLEMIEDVIYQLQDLQDLLEVQQKNLNKRTTRKKQGA